MTKPSPAAEPSMEEILASIRRIIADGDEPQGPSAHVVQPLRPAAVVPGTSEAADDHVDIEDDEDILELTEEMFASPPETADREQDEGGLSEDDESPTLEDELAEMPIVEPQASEVMFSEATAEREEPEPQAARPRASEPSNEAAAEAGRSFASDSRPAGSDKDPPFHESPRQDARRPGEHLMSPSTDATVAAAFGRLAGTIATNESRTLEDIVVDMLRPMLKEWMDDNLPSLVEKLVRSEIERVSRGRP